MGTRCPLVTQRGCVMKIGNAFKKWLNGDFNEQLVVDIWQDPKGQTDYQSYCKLAYKYQTEPVTRILFHKICKDLQRQYELSVKDMSDLENRKVKIQKHEFYTSA